MTTLIKQSTSPHLPANHPNHVARILAREEAWRAVRKRIRVRRIGVGAAAIATMFISLLLFL